MQPKRQGWTDTIERLKLTDQEAGGQATREERAAIEDALAKVEKFLSGGASGSLTVLYLGIGVGNPGTTWMNPSHGLKGQGLLEVQVIPPVLADLESKGYRVVGLNFNVAGSESLPEPTRTRLHLPVPARFPLTGSSSSHREVMDVFRALVRRFDRLLVVNAVSQLHYPYPVELVAGYDWKVSRAMSHVPASYVVSYAETGEQVAYAPTGPRATKKGNEWVCTGKPTALRDEDDVFRPIT
jgi:hypothetical protein